MRSHLLFVQHSWFLVGPKGGGRSLHRPPLAVRGRNLRSPDNWVVLLRQKSFPGRRQRVRPSAGPMTGSAASPEPITTAPRLWIPGSRAAHAPWNDDERPARDPVSIALQIPHPALYINWPFRAV